MSRKQPGDLCRVVGANVRRYRKELGMSQHDFGDALGLHRTRIGKIERGEENPTLQSVERIASALGLHPLDLLADIDQPLPPAVTSAPRRRRESGRKRPERGA